MHEPVTDRQAQVQGDEAWTEKLSGVVALCLALAILICGLWIYLPFFEPICWAIILSLFFYPLYQRLVKVLMGQRVLASFIMCFLIVAFIIIPVFFLITSLTSEVLRVYTAGMSNLQTFNLDIIPDPQNYPTLNKLTIKLLKAFKLYGTDLHGTLVELTRSAGEYFLKKGTVVFRNIAVLIFKSFLMLVILFYLFTDGENMLRAFKGLLPLKKESVERFMKLTSDVLAATLYGNIFTGIIQAGLGIFIFWALGFSAPILWGTILGLGTFVPMIGTAIVWAPASIYLLVTAQYLKGAALLAFSLLVISQIDYFLRPYLISGKTELHNLFLFLGIIGGINVFGLLGLILGPMVIALCMSILELYRLNLLEREEAWKKDLLI